MSAQSFISWHMVLYIWLNNENHFNGTLYYFNSVDYVACIVYSTIMRTRGIKRVPAFLLVEHYNKQSSSKMHENICTSALQLHIYRYLHLMMVFNLYPPCCSTHSRLCSCNEFRRMALYGLFTDFSVL